VPRAGRWCCVSIALFAAAPCAAQEAPVSLDWRAPPECPAREVVLTRVAQLHPVGGGAHLDATATVTRRPSGRWRVRIETPSGVRALETRACAQIAEATAVILALALDDLAPTPSVARPTLPATVEQVPDDERVPVPRPPAAPAPTRVETSLGPRLSLDTRAMPDLAWGAGLFVAWTWRSLRVELAPSVTYGSRNASGANAGFDALRVDLTARGCAMVGGDLRVGACAALSGGWLRATASGVALAVNGDAPWIAAGGTLLARLGARRVAALVAVDVMAPIARPRFVVTGATEAYEVPAFTVLLSLGVEFVLR
jgi:hypothetical protein